MASRTRTEAEHETGRTRGGLCRGGGSSDCPPAPAGRLTYRTLQLQFQLDDAHLDALKDELIEGQRLAVDEAGRVLVWTGTSGAPAPAAAPSADIPAPLTYTPPYLAEKILTSKSALEGERKLVTVLFADLKGSTELIRDLDPEVAQRLLDPALRHMMDAVHRLKAP